MRDNALYVKWGNMRITIEKKNGSIEEFNVDKIVKAITSASDRIGRKIGSLEMESIIRTIHEDIQSPIVHVKDMHKIVCRAIKQYFPDVASSYQNYRDYKLTYARDFDKLFQQAKDVLFLGDRENANFDSALISTKGSLIRGYTTSMLYKKFYLHRDEAEAIRRGDIYFHDLRDMIMGSFNCNLFDIGTVMRGGFEMANIHYNEPNSVLSALQVTGDVTLSASAQQSI